MENWMMKGNSVLSARRLRIGLLSILLALAMAAPVRAQAPPTFSKSFAPNTIGMASVTTLTFNITNADPVNPVTDLAFTDTLPAAVRIAAPANATSTCGGTLTAPDRTNTISLSDGGVGAGGTCAITVNVTSSTIGIHMNVSGDLTSSAGNSGPASADLTVAIERPGFSKSFTPNSIPLGSRSTLTFTIDNTLNEGGVSNLSFTDNLPAGMEIADPANAATTCGTAPIAPTLTADAGTSLIALSYFGVSDFPAVAGGDTCTVTVDVVATGGGLLGNISEELMADFASAGRASATLEATVAALAIRKTFVDDPAPPGGAVTLDFRIDNFDRSFSATSVSFTDDLGAALAGLTFSSLLSNDCGGSVSGLGSDTIALTDGSVAPESFCTISTRLTAPVGAAPGAYTNTTGAVTATVDASPVVGNTASDDLFVAPVPLLTKLFVSDSVGAGETVTLRFTIMNTSATSGATDIEFIDELTDGSSGNPADPTSGFLPFPVQAALPPTPDPPCGGGSSLALISLDIDRQALFLSGGSLAAAGMAGDSCTFDVTLTVPVGFPSGVYVNTTEEITATVDGETRTGKPASDDLVVAAAPSLLKAFTDDPVDPGDTVTLEFTLTHDLNAPADATGIAFSDDLSATLAGLTAIGLPITDVCGSGSQLSGTTNLVFTGGSLAPGASCVFSATLQVPAAAPAGSHTNTTSNVTATVDGQPATANSATDDLKVAGLSLVKSFTDDPVIPGETVTLEFTISNTSPITDGTADATAIFFTDNLDVALSNLTAVGLPLTDICGAGSQLTGTSGNTNLVFSNGSLLAGESCTFSVTLQTPLAAASATYSNTTSSFLASIDGSIVTFDNASDDLTVSSDLLLLSKSFTDDPVAPGGAVTLEFTLNNLDATRSATSIAFTDDLDAALAGLTAATLLSNACGGSLGGIGTSALSFTGGALGPGATCALSVRLDVPAGLSFGAIATNTTSQVAGSLGGLSITGPPASDDLQIDFLAFTKAFDGPTIAGGAPMLTFTIQNLNATAGVGDISFTDDLDAVLSGLVATGLPLNDICGTGSQLAGASFLTLTGGDLLPGGWCTINVPLQVPPTAAPGDFLSVTSDLFSAGLPLTGPASATLTVVPTPSFSKSFTPAAIAFRGVSTVDFTIDNTASSVAASSLDFTDNLPAGMVIATPSNASTTCAGGALTAAAGSSVITYSGGSVAAATSCTITVDVTSSTVGLQVNTTGDLTSSLGVIGAASAALDVLAPSPAITLTTLPATQAVIAGGAAAFTVTVTNIGDVELTNVTVSDPLAPDCARTLGMLASGATSSYDCSLSGVSADFTNVATVVGTPPVGAPVTASASVVVDALVPAISLSMTPAAQAVIAGGAAAFTVTVTNVGDVELANVTVSDPLAPDCARMLGALASGAALSYDCALSGVSADFSNVATVVGTPSAGAPVMASASAEVAITSTSVPGFSKSFEPNSMDTGAISTLTLTIDNTANAVAATGLAFTDNLPPDVAVATPANGSTTCTGGALTAAAGTSVITYSGGMVAAGASCTITVDVTSATAGMHVNTVESLTSSLGASGPATATLTVNIAGLTITFPRAGDKIAGNAVAVAFFQAPLNAAAVLFQFRPLGSPDWIDIGTATIPPFYYVAWDTLALDGIVELRALAQLDDNTTRATAPIQVTIDNRDNASGITVFGDGSIQTVTMPADEDSIAVTGQGVIIEIPDGTLDADDTIIVNVIQPQDAPGEPPGEPAALLADITLASGQDMFANPLTIRMAYADEDQDGAVDGSSLNENALTLWFFDDDTASWATVMGAVVRPEANVVEGAVTHLTVFGPFEAPLPETTLQATLGAASPEPGAPVTLTSMSRDVSILQVQLAQETEICSLTNAAVIFTNPRGKGKLAEGFFVDLFNDDNGDGVADPGEEVLATAVIMDIRESISLTFDPPLVLTPGATVSLLFTLTGPSALTAQMQQSILPTSQGVVPLVGLVVGVSTVLGIFMAWRRRRGFWALLIVCMLGWSLVFAGCHDIDKVTFTVTLPANGLRCEGDITGAFTVPDAPLVGAKVTMRR